MSENVHDVLIIGAGPAGATAANILAAKQHSVVLVDRRTFPQDASAGGWLNAKAADLLNELDISTKGLLDQPIEAFTFYDSTLEKSATPKPNGLFAYLVDRVKLDNAMVAAAKKRGVKLVTGATVKNLHLGEDAVRAELETGDSVSGRLMLLASGRGTRLIERASLKRRQDDRVLTGQVESRHSDVRGGPRVAIVLGLEKSGSFAFVAVSKERYSISISWLGAREEATRAFVAVCRKLAANGIVPGDLSSYAASTRLVPSPAAAALDMDSHVGKHTLLIGDAGGFVSAISNEGFYPAMWSAQIASEVAHKALRSSQSQDVLMSFEQEWRMTMADYLRPPNTDVQFLLPLVFSNQPMADRMAAAFFHGENI